MYRYKMGEVVYFDELYFYAAEKDEKFYRPCLILFSEILKSGQEKLFYCTMTTSIRQFNNRPKQYHLLTLPLFDEKILSFVNMTHLYSTIADNTVHSTGLVLPIDNYEVIRKIYQINYFLITGMTEEIKNTMGYITDIVRPLELTDEKAKQYLKNR